jgi:hypothetical protein
MVAYLSTFFYKNAGSNNAAEESLLNLVVERLTLQSKFRIQTMKM